MSHFKSRFIIADPSLVDGRGHHFSLTMQITCGARARGIRTEWFTHRDFALPTAVQGVPVYAVFSTTMYDRYHPEKKKSLPKDPDQCLLGELYDGITQARLTADDHVFFHTAYADVYRMILRLLMQTEAKRAPFLHLCTPYDTRTMPGRDAGNDLEDVFGQFRTMAMVDRRVFFWAETPQLASHYSSTFGFNVRGLTLPPPYDTEIAATRQNKDALSVLYLGAAREEKGFLLLPEIVNKLYPTLGRAGKIRFIIQCSPQIIGYLPNIRAAIAELRRHPEDYLTLIDYVLDNQTYQEYLSSADVVLLLYDKQNYRIRGSGIAIEAVCSGKCLLTHRGTFCASLITEGGGAAVDTVDEAVSKLSEMANSRERYRVLGARQGERYRRENSADRYVARMMSQAEKINAVPFFPSKIVGNIAPQLIGL